MSLATLALVSLLLGCFCKSTSEWRLGLSFFNLASTVADSSVKPAEGSIKASHNLCCPREFLGEAALMSKTIPYCNCTNTGAKIVNNNNIELSSIF